jgi:enamine deaminase RidA (YjgF/YER057c/UK114 family)
MDPHEKTPMHEISPRLVVWVTDAHLKDTFSDGTSQELRRVAGAADWVPAQRHSGKNLGDKPVEFLAILPKTPITPGGAGAPSGCFHLNAPIETEIGYCQAVRTGNLLQVSGSVGKGEMPLAIRRAYDELKKTLDAYGLGFSNVVKENVFTTDLDAFIANKEIRKEYYGAGFPAASWVQVQRLYSPAYVVEVEITAEFLK